jgi:UDP-N-acetylmuramate: L-alanyl-gamma-D-glutamyl-meso-diaminopimelate ligase
MHLHILGICGTFMGGIALLARDLGHKVTGSDSNIYPPMSDQLEATDIELIAGYNPLQLEPAPDLTIIGNSLSRGNECVEYVLKAGLRYTSGPQWLAENILIGRHVMAVSGTHGKTTTTSMLAWILESAGLQPGFLVGGIAENFGLSAHRGSGSFFVVEADEYDTGFFDKRSKFIHYHPATLVIGNIEYDHADIFDDIGAIKREFHHLIRTIPATGKIIIKADDREIQDVLEMGCWTPVEGFGIESGSWRANPVKQDFSEFEVSCNGAPAGLVKWELIGRHNAENALAAIAASRQADILPADACTALARFKSVKRRLQKLAETGGITVYDDFAHHPTAIRVTLEALRRNVGRQRIIVIMEPRSNTMKLGIHGENLPRSLLEADLAIIYQASNTIINHDMVARILGAKASVSGDIEEIIELVLGYTRPGDHVVIMSNGGFENIHQRLIARLPHAG